MSENNIIIKEVKKKNLGFKIIPHPRKYYALAMTKGEHLSGSSKKKITYPAI